MQPFSLVNAYDSHVHWLETGLGERRLSLTHLKKFADVATLTPEPKDFQGDWLLGWGWDQTKYGEPYPTRELLDTTFGIKTPCCFFRADGHALWASTEALRRSSLLSGAIDTPGGKTIHDEDGTPTGILVDHAMNALVRCIPALTIKEVEDALLSGMNIFLRAGFTHIRDLSCDEIQWNACMRLFESHRLSFAVEQFFDAVKPSDFDRALDLALRARREKTDLVRVKGIKVYYDGALGSEGALLSLPYRCEGSHHGLSLASPDELEDMIRRTWDHGLEIAVHCIGDKATDDITAVACKLWDGGAQGKLHLEHVEMARLETLKRLAKRNVHCHLQPCHWLTDRIWLKEKLGPLFSTVFPWRKLEELAIPFDFGSDSPIEEPSLFATYEALNDSKKAGIAAIKSNWLHYHSHPDRGWTPDTETSWDGSRFSVKFLGKLR